MKLQLLHKNIWNKRLGLDWIWFRNYVHNRSFCRKDGNRYIPSIIWNYFLWFIIFYRQQNSALFSTHTKTWNSLNPILLHLAVYQMNRSSTLWRLPSLPRKCEGKLECSCHSCMIFFDPVSIKSTQLESLDEVCPMGHYVNTHQNTTYRDHFNKGGLTARNQGITALSYNPFAEGAFRAVEEAIWLPKAQPRTNKGRKFFNVGTSPAESQHKNISTLTLWSKSLSCCFRMCVQFIPLLAEHCHVQ